MTPSEVIRWQRRCSSGFTWHMGTRPAPPLRQECPPPTVEMPQSLDEEMPNLLLPRRVYSQLLRAADAEEPLPKRGEIMRRINTAHTSGAVDKAFTILERDGFLKTLERNGANQRIAVQLRDGRTLRIER